MKVLIIGAAGMIGRKLTARLARDGRLAGQTIDHAHLVDIVAPQPLDAPFPVALEAFDIAAPYVAPKLIAARPDVIFLLASIVSGEAEADFDKGYAINVDGTHALFEAIRREHELAGGAYRPRLVFTSSIAVFGAPFPAKIGDEFFPAPLTSYGTQKAICELLLADYSRRGFFDGIGIRLPTIWCAPARPTRRPRASSPASSASRWRARKRCFRSATRSATGTPRRAPRSSSSMPRRNSISPARRPPVAQPARRDRHRRRADRGAQRHRRREDGSLIRREPNETIDRIVAGWPRDFDASRARASDFAPTTTFRSDHCPY